MADTRMSPSDEEELHRLCNLISAADRLLPESSPIREGLRKAALALQGAFAEGLRTDIEKQYAELGAPLSKDQQEHLKRLGIDRDH
jgi:hypothetical protein